MPIKNWITKYRKGLGLKLGQYKGDKNKNIWNVVILFSTQ